jgi:uncharacterized membrane protein
MTSTSRPAANGWTWIVDAWTLFTRAPFVWIVIAVILIVLLLVPVLNVIASVLMPVFAGGIMLGCRRLHEGGALVVADLFAGFQTRFGALAAIGVISTLVALVIAFVAGLVTGINLFTLDSNPDPEAMRAAAFNVLLTVLIATALMLPLAMALWFAAPLVVLQNQGVLRALAQSFAACLQNMLPFLLYGVILLVLAVVASIPFGLGWLVLLPVITASVYTAYRDIFPS